MKLEFLNIFTKCFTFQSLDDDTVVKDSIVMKPDFSARRTQQEQDEAATKIQNHWRRRSAEKQQNCTHNSADVTSAILNDSVSCP